MPKPWQDFWRGGEAIGVGAKTMAGGEWGNDVTREQLGVARGKGLAECCGGGIKVSACAAGVLQWQDFLCPTALVPCYFANRRDSLAAAILRVCGNTREKCWSALLPHHGAVEFSVILADCSVSGDSFTRGVSVIT